MDFALPQAYLLGLIVLLGVVAVVVGQASTLMVLPMMSVLHV